MKKKNASIIHNGKGWNGIIENEEEYIKLLLGEIKFSKGDKELSAVTMPYEIFLRLFQLDRISQGIEDTSSPASNIQTKISDKDITRLLSALASIGAYSHI